MRGVADKLAAIGVVGLLGLLGLQAAGCGRDPNDLFAPEAGTIVVDAFLVVGQPLPRVVLSQTLAADVPYSHSAAALAGATVRVSHSFGTYSYVEAPDRFGIYDPAVHVFVEPGTEYRLEIVAADGRRVTATTRTPAPFAIGEWLLLDDAGTTVQRQLATFGDYGGDSLFARPENQLLYSDGLLEARYDASGIIGIQVGLFSRTPDSPRVIDPEFIDDEDLESLPRSNASPPLDPTSGAVRLPWFAIFFEGRYVLKVWTMDRNWYDLARTDPVLRGGGIGFGGQAGDEFERPIFRLDGGIGLFGSGAVDSLGVVILPRPPSVLVAPQAAKTSSR
jgi:hypothetical protein